MDRQFEVYAQWSVTGPSRYYKEFKDGRQVKLSRRRYMAFVRQVQRNMARCSE